MTACELQNFIFVLSVDMINENDSSFLMRKKSDFRHGCLMNGTVVVTP